MAAMTWVATRRPEWRRQGGRARTNGVVVRGHAPRRMVNAARRAGRNTTSTRLCRSGGKGATPAGFMSSSRRVEWIPEVPGWPGRPWLAFERPLFYGLAAEAVRCYFIWLRFCCQLSGARVGHVRCVGVSKPRPAPCPPGFAPFFRPRLSPAWATRGARAPGRGHRERAKYVACVLRDLTFLLTLACQRGGEGATPAGFMSSARRVEWIPEVPGWPGRPWLGGGHLSARRPPRTVGQQIVRRAPR